MISDLEKRRRMKALDLTRRQEAADRAKRLREGVPAEVTDDGQPPRDELGNPLSPQSAKQD